MSTHNICFREEIRKIFSGPPLVWKYDFGPVLGVIDNHMHINSGVIVYTLIIRTPLLITLLVLNFEQIHLTTNQCVECQTV